MPPDLRFLKHFHGLGGGQPQKLHDIPPLISAGQGLLVVAKSAAGLALRHDGVHKRKLRHDHALSAAHRAGARRIKAEQAVGLAALPRQQLSNLIEKSQVRGWSGAVGGGNGPLVDHHHVLLILSGDTWVIRVLFPGARHAGHHRHDPSG